MSSLGKAHVKRIITPLSCGAYCGVPDAAVHVMSSFIIRQHTAVIVACVSMPHQSQRKSRRETEGEDELVSEDTDDGTM